MDQLCSCPLCSQPVHQFLSFEGDGGGGSDSPQPPSVEPGGHGGGGGGGGSPEPEDPGMSPLPSEDPGMISPPCEDPGKRPLPSEDPGKRLFQPEAGAAVPAGGPEVPDHGMPIWSLQLAVGAEESVCVAGGGW